jgi:hypothetical protein
MQNVKCKMQNYFAFCILHLQLGDGGDDLTAEGLDLGQRGGAHTP